jgi:murein DD-endopeptidase MepM/ murein hydrolase activator NlpD
VPILIRIFNTTILNLEKNIMMKNKAYFLILLPVAIIVLAIAWFFIITFEGGNPILTVDPVPEVLSKKQTFTIKVSDAKRGIRALKASYTHGGKEETLIDEKFSFEGILNGKGTHDYEKEIVIDPQTLHLSQGTMSLTVQAWDYSRKNGGDGNTTVLTYSLLVDTMPPTIRPLSQMHNVNQGGTGLVVYQASSDTDESGVYVDDRLFKGYPATKDNKNDTYVAYFAIPYNITANPSIKLWARDKAGNTVTTAFTCLVKRIQFRSDNMELSDAFLQKVLPYFSGETDPGLSDIDNYVQINKELRKKNNAVFFDLMKDLSDERLWEGSWLRLKNAAPMAKYADHRKYLYNNKLVDEEDHLGDDLASTANAPVEAENSGRIIFAERNGIYGNAVVIDHGQGIASVYGHLSDISVTKGQDVKKGDTIGHTGQTGLAGGDHLHVSIMVQGVFVNPKEWWDDHWIQDNITAKLNLIQN